MNVVVMSVLYTRVVLVHIKDDGNIIYYQGVGGGRNTRSLYIRLEVSLGKDEFVLWCIFS
jgi:hypothetical protein